MTNIECVGCKLYPTGATVNSHNGITNIDSIVNVLKYMEKKDIPCRNSGL
jgi:dihydroorotase